MKQLETLCADAADLLEHTAVLSATDSMGKTVEPFNISINIGDVSNGVDNPDGINVDVSSVDDTVTDAGKQASIENFDEGRPTVIDIGNDTKKDENVTPSIRDTAMEDAEVVTSMDVPSVDGIGNVAEGREDVTPNVAATGARAEVEIPKAVGQEKKKSKKRKYKSNADEGEASEPKKKLSKKERASKKSRSVERNARRATEETTGAIEQNEAGNDEAEQGSDNEDIDAVIIRRRKAKGKLKINENRSRVGNKRVSKNVTTVSIENVALNSEEEEAKWRFVASRRIDAEKMLSENTKKNTDIMSILEDASIMPTVKTVGPYYPTLVREFICNMIEEIDDPKSPNFQKVTLRNCTIEFSPSIIDAYLGELMGVKQGPN
ncbi:hypothetical protein LIER_05992 [Lithospermum erythrorhizon]|uniref:Uncharacterized protein n=1 Tax=Lithospermum erythrorhizon TaxID=34254 RepID=A0AAV3P3W2_LITER